MTYEETIQFLYSLRLFGTKLGLEKTTRLAELAGNPQNQLKFIHVAGTNGKGSTCAMLESIYRHAGFRTGLFTSPHLVRFSERIQVNRHPISDADVIRLAEYFKTFLPQFPNDAQPSSSPPNGATPSPSPLGGERAGVRGAPAQPSADTSGIVGQPTFFEVTTVMALKYFAEQKCDIVIWETGMGGRLDATNIVTPLASVITNIQFDHEKWLGNTLAEIAFEKAGIIKPGIPVITGAEAPEALEVIRRTAAEKNAPLTEVSNLPSLNDLSASEEIEQRTSGPLSNATEQRTSGPLAPSEGERDRVRGSSVNPSQPNQNLPVANPEIEVPLLGQHQKKNAAVAVATVKVLNQATHAIADGLRNIHWPGRLQLEKLSDGRTVLLDGAHNLAGVETLATALETLFPSQQKTLILGMLTDKQWREMSARLAPLAETIYTCPVSSERTADTQALATACAATNPKAAVKACATLTEALALSDKAPFTVISGSLHFIGEAMEKLGITPTPTLNERALNEWQATPR